MADDKFMADDDEELGVIGSGYGYGLTPNEEYRQKLRDTMRLAYELDNPVLMWTKIQEYLKRSCIFDEDPEREGTSVSDIFIMPEMADFFLETANAIAFLARGARVTGEVMEKYETDLDRNPGPVLPKEAIALLPQALNFTRRGYNAFAQLASMRQKAYEAALYDCLLTNGLSSREALDALSRELGEMDHSRRRRRIREGRRFRNRGLFWEDYDQGRFLYLCRRMKIDPYKNL
ncbi:hypothetical protein Gxy13693_008_022 [Komagataeibacter xylinus NBRC 13693]|uniref:Uncharacterized protein n=1 Tax=Komagataeibacter xylinus NBRC 13693 TaxID=1234668 RepID=A0A0D6Q5L6_KOMXY|nr:hypothetical protein [Komagataeibacter xylinus]GAN98648.1 hypothetical protein Gxy13693_008_022 [Komagataeibacter xylinus NBRC 13693]